MKKFRFIGALTLVFTLLTSSFISSGFTSKFGLDKYEVYLNNRLLMRRYVNEPLDLRVLQLEKASPTDYLQISYSHCRKNNGAGTGRSLTLKDENGQALRQWKFADASGNEIKMSLAVKDLQQLATKNAGHQLILYYSSQELNKGEMLAMIRFK